MMTLDECCSYYYQGIMRHAYALTHDPETSQDLTQIVFMKLSRTWKPEMEDWDEPLLWRWLHQMMKRSCIDQWRSDTLRPTCSLELHQWYIGDPPDPCQNLLLREALRKALARISEKKRRVFFLFFLYGYTAGEIAEMLGITEYAAKTRIYRAREDLRKEYRA